MAAQEARNRGSDDRRGGLGRQAEERDDGRARDASMDENANFGRVGWRDREGAPWHPRSLPAMHRDQAVDVVVRSSMPSPDCRVTGVLSVRYGGIDGSTFVVRNIDQLAVLRAHDVTNDEQVRKARNLGDQNEPRERRE